MEKPADCKDQRLPLRRSDRNLISDRKIQAFLNAVGAYKVRFPFRKFSLHNPGCRQHLHQSFIKPADDRLRTFDLPPFIQPVVSHIILGACLYFRSCSKHRCLFIGKSLKCGMPASVFLDCLDLLAPDRHIRHAKKSHDQKYR